MKIRHIDWYPDEWLGGTIELGNAERGLYITACNLIYSTGGPITRERLRAACRDHGHAFNRQLATLIEAGKLVVNGGQIINKRSINELQKAHKRSANAQQNGSKGGRPHNQNNEVEKPEGFRGEKLRARSLTTNYQPSTKKERDARGAAFAEWYEKYPHKVGKAAAEKAYSGALKKADPEALAAGLEAYIAAKPPDRAWCNPATWLHQERWLDQPATATNGINGNVGYTGPTTPAPRPEDLWPELYEPGGQMAGPR